MCDVNDAGSALGEKKGGETREMIKIKPESRTHTAGGRGRQTGSPSQVRPRHIARSRGVGQRSQHGRSHHGQLMATARSEHGRIDPVTSRSQHGHSTVTAPCTTCCSVSGKKLPPELILYLNGRTPVNQAQVKRCESGIASGIASDYKRQ